MADNEDSTATAGTAVSSASSMFGNIPVIGSFISGAGALVSGALEKNEARKQTDQAAALRDQANRLGKENIRSEFLQKLNYDQQLASGDLPGLQLYKNWLGEQTANHLRAIQNSSPSGAASVNAVSAALYGENDSLNKLGIQNASYKADANKTISEDLGMLGTQQRGLEIFRNGERDKMLGQANALEAAGTGNKTNANNIITGAVGSTGSNIFKNLSDPNYLKGLGIGGGNIGGTGVGGTTAGGAVGGAVIGGTAGVTIPDNGDDFSF